MKLLGGFLSILILCIAEIVFLYFSTESYNLQQQRANMKSQLITKINKLTKQLYLNQMSNLFQLESKSVENHTSLVNKIIENLEICKQYSNKNQNELVTLDMINIYLTKYDSFFKTSIIPFYNKQYALARNAMAYSLTDAEEIENPAKKPKKNDNTKKNNKMTQDEYIKFLKELEAKLEESRNQIDDAMKNQLNYDGSLIIEEIQKRIDLLESIYINDSKNAAVQFKKRTFYTSIISILIILLLGLYLSIGMSNLISRPIKNLVEKMHLVEAGNLDTQVEVTSSDEFGILENSFNRMIAGLKVANEEVNLRQRELTYLNQILENSNKELEKAYKELKQTQTQLIQREKMASLGMLVSGIAHEINNPLGVIHCNVDLYKTMLNYLKNMPDVTENQQVKELMDKMESTNETSRIACDRIINIVKSLKNFARLDEAEIQIADIHQGIDDTLILLNNKLKDRIEIVKNYGKVPKILCYPQQLNQAFMNILINSIEAIRDKGTIWISTYTQDNNVVIKIKDNGVGIKPEHIDKIFDPGFTTKGVGVGTGLGLAIVYRIIEQHKGKIFVESQYGVGTEFTIQIPLNLSENDLTKSV